MLYPCFSNCNYHFLHMLLKEFSLFNVFYLVQFSPLVILRLCPIKNPFYLIVCLDHVKRHCMTHILYYRVPSVMHPIIYGASCMPQG